MSVMQMDVPRIVLFKDEPFEVGEVAREYQDPAWASLLKSKMISIGLATNDSYVAVVKHDVNHLNAVSLKQFKVLRTSEIELKQVVGDPSFPSIWGKILDDLSSTKGLYPEPYVSYLNFFSVELKSPSLSSIQQIVVDVASEYGMPGFYVCYDAAEKNVVSIVVVSLTAEPTIIAPDRFISEQLFDSVIARGGVNDDPLTCN